MEWTNKAKYNSFNSYKGLAYYEKYRQIAKWLEGKGQLPAPVECSLDPITYCSLRCYYCNSQRYLWQNPEETKMKRLPGDYMRHLTDFLADWGVRGLCLGGGGESLLNKEAWDLPSYAVSRGMEAAIVTNGTVMNDIILENMLVCRWVGFSVDAADREIYRRIHGRDYFDRVIKNIGMLTNAKQRSKNHLGIAFKVLILEENVDTLYECCKLAKELGVDDFHIRPVDLERKDYRGKQFFDHNIPNLLEAFQRCHEEETEDFHVYTVLHKYSPELRTKHDFEQCLASPLVIQCCTNGDVSICVDHRIETRFKLGTHYPDPEKILDWWGNEHHKQLLLSIKPDEECGRCTWSEYNRQVKEVAILDEMCLAFP